MIAVGINIAEPTYNKVKGYSFKVKMNLTERQKKILKAGGRLILARNQEV